jgi:hypothetical protein
MSALDEQVGGTHYQQFAIQPSEYIYRNKLDWLSGNIVKYATRHPHKGQGAADCRKIIHYARMLLLLEYGEDE